MVAPTPKPIAVFHSTDDILRYAASREAAAVELYTQLAAQCTQPIMRLTFLEFAAEEQAHQMRLKELLAKGRPFLPTGKPVESLGIARHLPEVKPSADLGLREALQLAMSEEKKAFLVYWKLAEATKDQAALHQTFLGLAQEEARHKLRFELDYERLSFEKD